MSARRPVAWGLGVIAAAILAQPAAAYLKIGTRVGSQIVPIKWTSQPVQYFITNRDVPGVTASQLQVAVQQAFQTWAAVPSATIQPAHWQGFTSTDPFTTDTISEIGFLSRPDLDRVLASTTFEVNDSTGELLASDIFFNSSVEWSVAPGGDSAAFDVQSIALHELGHFFGLYHSLLGETDLQANGGRRVLSKNSVMFPIAYPRGNIDDRALKADDVAGISDTYGTDQFKHDTGSVTGRITLNGAGVFGAHVIAVNQTTGVMIGGFSLDGQGRFTIAGLKPGIYVLRAEPIDDADLNSFFDDQTAASVNINFKASYFDRLVAVPAGGSGVPIEIKVSGK